MSKAEVLMSLLPPLYENVLEMQLLTETEGEELEKLASGLEGVLDQFYPESATWALERYEQDLQIPTNPAKPEEQRRSVIISKMRGSGKVSGSMLKNVAQAYESGGIDVSVDSGEYHIIIRFIDTLGLPPNLDDLKAAVEDIKPAHMTVEYRLRYLTIAEVESMTLAEIEATWQDKFLGGGA
ncbi:putative phage tail protein [Paenibacillus sp. 7516]|uniref:putative phage tail protein n=1 Tax=Paenibacillus sp. 7516 TaxID=2022549 RepID=UPI000BA6D492|nr:putative phage tail protein [Paenibacillus sp. 7516]PAF31532.1 phage portal protein [Paenibacillus sp. 7516]